MAAGDQKADLGLWAGPWPCQWRFGPFIGGDGRAIRWIRHHGVGRFNRVTRRRMPAGTALLCSRAPCTSFPSPLSSLAHAERTRHGETRDSAGDHIACPGVRQNTRPRQSRTVLTGASACRSGPLSPSGRPQILHPTAGSRLSKDDVCIFHGPELCGRDGAASRENWYIHPRPRPSPFVLANQHNVLFQRAFADQRQASPVRFPHAIISCI